MPFHPDLLRLDRPRQIDLRVVRADSVLIVFTVRTSAGTRVPLTGLSGQAVVRVSVDDPVAYPLDVEVSQSPAGLQDTGRITLSAPGGRTLLWPDVGHWGLQVADGPEGLVRKTLVQGRLRLVRDLVVP